MAAATQGSLGNSFSLDQKQVVIIGAGMRLLVPPASGLRECNLLASRQAQHLHSCSLHTPLTEPIYAGPSGLHFAKLLQDRYNVRPIIVEQSDRIGGKFETICKDEFDGYPHEVWLCCLAAH